MLRRRLAAGRVRATAVASVIVLVASLGCVEWNAVDASPGDSPSLPRWVRVTTSDSARRLLEDAAFRGDTLVGQGGDGPQRGAEVRIARSSIARLEAREPSMSRSAGMAVVLMGGVLALAAALGWATR